MQELFSRGARRVRRTRFHPEIRRFGSFESVPANFSAQQPGTY